MTSETHLERYQRIPTASLFVPQEYQRECKPRWVDERIDSFQEDKLGTFVVVPRGNGRYAIVDGQHRLALVRAAQKDPNHSDVTSVWCEVRREESLESEARLFIGRSDARPLSKLEKFRARVIAAEPKANAIKDILKAHGVQIGFPGPNKDSANYGCVVAIEALYDDGYLDSVIKIIEESWGERFGRLARGGLFVEGLHVFYDTYHNHSDFTVSRAITQFSKLDKISILASQARNNAAANGTRAKLQLAILLLAPYNRNHKNRLPVADIIEAY